MSIPITRTKYVLPRRRADLLSRPRLLDMLVDLMDNKLIIIAAPAGYGKTSLVIDLASQTSMPTCWYALDPLDRDFKRFVTYLIASINRCFPKFGKQSGLALQNLSESNPDVDLLVTTIVNEAYDCIHEHFTIVLDDYHYIDDQEDINQFIGRFIQDMDENCHVIVTSRTLLTLPDLPLMVARSQVGGLGFDELAFQVSEIQALIQQNYGENIPEETATKIAEDTEGWITGLLLSTQVKWQGKQDRERLARVSMVGLYDYLAQQVLDQQSPTIRQFLLSTSPMGEFNAELCKAVLGEPPDNTESWSNLMETALRNHLFILPVGEDGLWLRYHNLFRDFLQSRLAIENPSEENRIVDRLAHVYSERGDWDRAYELFQRLGDTANLIELLKQAGSSLLITGRLNILARWIDALPSDNIVSQPMLLSLRGSVAVMLGEVERGLGLLNRSEKALRKEDDQVELARVLLRRTHAHRFLGHYQEALNDAEEALSLALTHNQWERIEAEALRSKGLCLFRLGQAVEAIDCLKESANLYDVIGSVENMALTQIDLGSIYRSQGDFDESRFAYQSALTRLKKSGDLARQATVLNNLGVLYHSVGDLDKAATYLDQAIQCAEKSGFARVEALALSSLGDLYRDLGALEGAMNAYQRASEISLRINDRFLNYYLAISAAIIYRLQGDTLHARDHLSAGLEIAVESKTPSEEAIYYRELGQIATTEGDYPLAERAYGQAIELYRLSHNRLEMMQTHLYQASLYQLSDRNNLAFDQLEKALLLAKEIKNLRALTVTAHEVRPLLTMALNHPNFSPLAKQLLSYADQLEKTLPAIRKRLRRQSSSANFTPARLSIFAFGKNQVQVDGKLVTSSKWQTQTARDLLFLLLAHPEGLTKEAIAGVFWPDSSPNQIKLQFKNTIYRLRHALEQEVVILEGDHYRFNQHLDYEYDVENFLSKTAQAQKSLTHENEIEHLLPAVSLYKGHYLPDLNSAWVIMERERLHQLYLGAVFQLIDLLTQKKLFDQAIIVCQELLIHDPCQEEAYRQSMRIYAAMGNPVGVARQYERCELTLRQQVNLTPSPQTKALFEKLVH